MKDKINTYFAVLLITIAGAGATVLIVHVANASTVEISSVAGVQYSN